MKKAGKLIFFDSVFGKIVRYFEILNEIMLFTFLFKPFLNSRILFFAGIVTGMFGFSFAMAQQNVPSPEKYTEGAAQRMIATSQGTLNPVYAPLAKQIVADYELGNMSSGIGIDLGAGPGELILELCARTNFHWINADINPHFFPYFFQEAEKRGLKSRISAIFADAHNLPFRDNYADVIVSRGSFHFWENKKQAFNEIYRVLKPGGVAFIGRGFARDMPVDVARQVRGKQKNFPNYDAKADVRQIESILQETDISSFRIERPVPPDSDGLTYGIWIEIRK